MSKRTHRQHKPASTSNIRRHLGNAVYVAVVGVLLVVAFWVLRGHWSLSAASSGEGAPNPSAVEQSSHPTDTDIAGMQAAEGGRLNQPALVWFHAGW